MKRKIYIVFVCSLLLVILSACTNTFYCGWSSFFIFTNKVPADMTWDSGQNTTCKIVIGKNTVTPKDFYENNKDR
jgi:hypothetical protein